MARKILEEYMNRKYDADIKPKPALNMIKDKTAIVGIGETKFTRGSGRDEMDMACEAIKKAADDAGIKLEDIDGLETFTLDRTAMPFIVSTLGLKNLRFASEVSFGGGAACAVTLHAAAIVATGVAKNVVCYRSLNESSGHKFGRGDGYAKYMLTAPTPHYGYTFPMGFCTPLSWAGAWGRRWMHEFNVSYEQIGWWAVVLREYANKNPLALFHNKPMTHEDYMNVQMIVEPLRLFDCCVDTDGACAHIVTTAERAKDLKQKPVYILGAGQSAPIEQEIQTVYNRPTIAGLFETWYAAHEAYRVAGVEGKDIDVAELYDPYSLGGIMSLEECDFCERGDAGNFIEGGDNIRVDGKMPTNTSGGLLSEAYIHGFNLVNEGVRQLRGTSYNQVKDPELCMVTAGPGVPSSAMVLRN